MSFEIWDRPLSLDVAIRAVSHDGAGAIATFVGVVRDNSDGHAVSLLEYEAYVPMAEKEMTRIGEEIRQSLPGTRIAAIHRVGKLTVGETAIVCAASAPHREQAFLACRRLIDTIKAHVPIWKREVGPDGSTWIGWTDARCRNHEHRTTETIG